MAVILHGSPFFTKAEQAEALAKGGYDRTLRADGSHFTQFYRMVSGFSQPDTPEQLRSWTWMLMSLYMMGPDIAHWAVYHHDMEPEARAIRAPTLIVTDAHDTIHHCDERLAALRPDFKYEVFSDYSGIQMMNEPKRWAAMVGDYIAPFER